jgi:hypothetical protein
VLWDRVPGRNTLWPWLTEHLSDQATTPPQGGTTKGDPR